MECDSESDKVKVAALSWSWRCGYYGHVVRNCKLNNGGRQVYTDGDGGKTTKILGKETNVVRYKLVEEDPNGHVGDFWAMNQYQVLLVLACWMCVHKQYLSKWKEVHHSGSLLFLPRYGVKPGPLQE
ncbi:hypothetical protein VNO78_08410 [Psophocarpus tetragonolobus]|uniref:CCHC-type domain-containing protein n=1 Tax=Psophocarpus tetragonolobus TaxID=3891 RepID=A0AAN9XTD8_PSOTE